MVLVGSRPAASPGAVVLRLWWCCGCSLAAGAFCCAWPARDGSGVGVERFREGVAAPRAVARRRPMQGHGGDLCGSTMHVQRRGSRPCCAWRRRCHASSLLYLWCAGLCCNVRVQACAVVAIVHVQPSMLVHADRWCAVVNEDVKDCYYTRSKFEA